MNKQGSIPKSIKLFKETAAKGNYLQGIRQVVEPPVVTNWYAN